MIEMVIIPEHVDEKIRSVNGDLYEGLFNADAMIRDFPINDLIDISNAYRRFKFEFDNVLGIKTCASPLDLLSVEKPDDDFTKNLRDKLEVESLKESDEIGVVSVYSLYPLSGNRWVTVEKRVRDKKSHLSKRVLQLNHDWFDDLIRRIYGFVPFHSLADTQLFKHYLTSSR